MIHALFDLLLPAVLHAIRLVVRFAAEILVEGSIVRLWQRVRTRHLRADARDWVEAGEWDEFHRRYADASVAERQALLAVGDGRPELAEMYAEALYGNWDVALPAVRVLKRRSPLPEDVANAVRTQLEMGGMRAEFVRPLESHLREGSPTPITSNPKAVS